MKNLCWKITGVGSCHLVLLHGWGMSAEVWHYIRKQLTSKFTLHLVDLPGFGHSQGYGPLPLEEMAQCVLKQAPKKAIWMGWSFGGLVASQAALIHPERILALVTVASSPCFSAREAWPGIKSEIFTSFQQQLNNNCHRTIERFLTLQILGSKPARKDAYVLRKIILKLPVSPIEVLNGSLEILKTVDLREELSALQLPHLRLYGHEDVLVPYTIASLLDILWPNSESLIIPKAAHAPFISDPFKFCSVLTSFSQRID